MATNRLPCAEPGTCYLGAIGYSVDQDSLTTDRQDSRPERPRARLRPLLLVAALVVAAMIARVIRGTLGIELSAESVHAAVEGFGWWAPAVYLLIVAFRPFLLLPSMVVLVAGGLCFGGIPGTVLGGAGIALAAGIQYSLARGVFGGAVHRRLATELRGLRHRIETAGPWLVGFVTAHPAGPMTPFHWAAGLTSIRAGAFFVVVVPAGTFRAGVFSAFGTSLLEPGSPTFYGATAVLLLAIVVPLLHAGVRRRLFPPEAAGREPIQ